jgi:hypothetical protein
MQKCTSPTLFEFGVINYVIIYLILICSSAHPHICTSIHPHINYLLSEALNSLDLSTFSTSILSANVFEIAA